MRRYFYHRTYTYIHKEDGLYVDATFYVPNKGDGRVVEMELFSLRERLSDRGMERVMDLSMENIPIHKRLHSKKSFIPVLQEIFKDLFYRVDLIYFEPANERLGRVYTKLLRRYIKGRPDLGYIVFKSGFTYIFHIRKDLSYLYGTEDILESYNYDYNCI